MSNNDTSIGVAGDARYVSPTAAPDIVVNGKSLRDYLRANMHDGDEGGTVTMPVKDMLDETAEIVSLWLHEAVRSDD